ncbi:MAG: carboxypeptidase-like regulatory domain-containing protein, partial [Planctomycetota bacterium]|nr:carboxypeptidase-like regulatory domain-containing protein [Planctomycetota bacterium]
EVFPPRWVSGRIEHVDGQAPGQQRLWLRSATIPGTLNGYSDEEGNFRLGPLPPGPAEIAVYAAQGHPGSAPQVCKAGSEDVRLTLRRSASIRALLSTSDGSPNPGLERILLTHPDGTVTEPKELAIDDLAPGYYALSVLAIDGR